MLVVLKMYVLTNLNPIVWANPMAQNILSNIIFLYRVHTFLNKYFAPPPL